jgi:hypothetical protein
MRTDDLVSVLAADATPRPGMERAFALALVAGAVAAVGGMLVALGVRTDVGAALETVRFPWKFVVTLALAATAVVAVRRLARPETRPRDALPLLALSPALLALSVVAELAVVSADVWAMRALGKNGLVCLTAVPALAALPLVAMLAALRHGAPSRPTISGAVAGLASGALAATAYAAHCTDDSPLFVALWYPAAIAIVTTAGALAGRVFARW